VFGLHCLDNNVSDDLGIGSLATTGQLLTGCGEATLRLQIGRPLGEAPRRTAQSPTFFGGALGIFGVNNCRVQGCTATATAVGCRGACGGQVSNPLDVVMILDRTGSMSGGDMANAQAGAKSILQIFNPNIQHVALGVLGPSSISSTCSGPNAGGPGVPASSGGSWIPVPLSSDYQNPDGSLNSASLIVRTISCLQTSSVGTDLGDPVLAAMNYLAANGRPNVHRAIILETDGAANVAPSGGNTGPATGPRSRRRQRKMRGSKSSQSGSASKATHA
jgi:hypothetical protein